jgi:hypothetical protein
VLVKNLLAEFDYTLQPAPSIPFIDTTKERSDMWLLKRYGLPFMYWNLILKGRAWGSRGIGPEDSPWPGTVHHPGPAG